MTLSSSESMAAPGDLSSQRLAMTRAYSLFDGQAAFDVGVDLGSTTGFARGYTVGVDRGIGEGLDERLTEIVAVPTGYDPGYADGTEDGIQVGLLRGVAAGRAAAYEEGRRDGVEEGVAASFPLAFGAGVAAVPPVETDPPELGTLTPDPGESPGDPGAFSSVYGTARDTPITIVVLDTVNVVAFVVLSVLYAGRSAWETIYAGRPLVDGVAGYRDGYTAFSGITGSGAPGVGFTFPVRRDAGWPGTPTLASEIKIDIQAVDAAGNVLA